MKLLARSLTLAALLGIATASANAQLTFNFEFDDTFDATVTPPIVGTGTLTLASDPGNGTFSYGTLNPTYSFTFGATTFTEANYVSNPALSTLVISNFSGGQRRLQFSDTGAGGGGPFGGSVDLTNGNDALSFEPSFVGEGLNLYFTNIIGGSYLALTPASTPVPEPGTLALLVGAGIGGMMLRRRKK